MDANEIEELVLAFHRKLANTPTKFYRYLYYQIKWEDSLIGIKGPKGCGKTTMLLQYIKNTFTGAALNKVLYVSLDNLWFVSHRFIDLVDCHYNNGGTHLFVDEVHYLDKWQTILKNISDDYPTLKIVYTGSSMLQIQSKEGDLSRRQAMYEMRGLSFREYLEYEGVMKMGAISLDTLLKEHISISMEVVSQVKVLPLFKKYIEEGYYPFYKQVHNGVRARLLAVVNQVIENDYPQIDEVSVATIRKAKKMLMILAERVPQLPKMVELYRELETDRNQGLKILNALERGGLLSLLSDDAKRFSELSKPSKIYVNNTTLAYALTPKVDIGTIRETFFLNQLSQAHDVRYPKSGDFYVDCKWLFEVGGKNKSFVQIKDIENSYLAIDDIETGYGAKIPLWLFGVLY